MTVPASNNSFRERPVYVDQAHLNSQKPIILGSCMLIIVALSGMLLSLVRQPNVVMASTAAASQVFDGPAALVTITSSGFNPATISVKRGQTVTWINEDTKQHQPASDPYPLDSGLAGFVDNVPLGNAATYGFTFNSVGTFTYHDQLDPFQFKGEVIVRP